MTAVDERFYITGGTLPLDAGSYVVRRADTDLLNGLQRGEFCYVLNTRQMGKSSLMIRTARRLKESGHQVAILDLTAVGLNLTVDQWYLGMLVRLASQLGHEDELIEFWRGNKEIGPMQRFVEAIRQVVLRSDPSSNPGSETVGSGPADTPSLIIFVDEIDSVRSLSFSADEFFAGIRQCYNRRAEDTEFRRLTFCLVGVATPADLIRETRLSPFNIGRRIELSDFTLEEAAVLANGIREQARIGAPESGAAHRMLERVFYWTNGHPYMTQRLCQAVADSLTQEAWTADPGPDLPQAVVDNVCARLFLTKAARETDDNLTFVRNRLLHSHPEETDLASLLDLYQRVRGGRRIPDDETNPLCAVLRLSGVVSAQKGLLRPRNRIYDRVFDRQWISEHMPGAEVRRQRRAYRRGVLRAATIGTIAVFIASGLAGLAISREFEARRSRDLAQAASRRAADQERIANSRLSRFYVAEGVERVEEGDYAAALTPLAEAMALDQHDPERMRQHRMRWEAVLSMAPRLERVFFSQGPVRWAEYSADRRLVLACDEAGRARVWQVDTGAELPIEMKHDGPVGFAAFSPDGRRVVTCGDDAFARVWDLQTRRLVFSLRQPISPGGLPRVVHASWSPDGRSLVTAAFGGAAMWDVSGSAARRVAFVDEPGAILVKTAVSPDGKHVALAASNFLGWVVDLKTGESLHPIGTRTMGGFYTGNEVRFSPDGALLAAAGGFGGSMFQNRGAAILHSAAGKRAIPFLSHGTALGTDVAFSPDSSIIATAGDDQTARLWDGRTGRPLFAPLQLGARVSRVCFSSDGKRLLTASVDGSVSVWDVATATRVCAPIRHAGAIVAAQFGRDSSQILTASKDSTTRIWTLPSSSLPAVSIARTALASHDRLLSDNRLALITSVSVPSSPKSLWNASVLDLRTGKTLFPRAAATGEWGTYGLSGDRRRIALYSWSARKMRVWDVERGLPVGPEVRGLQGPLNHDGTLLCLFDPDQDVRVVDTATGTTRTKFEQVAQCEFSPGGKVIAVSDRTGSVRLTDVDSGRLVARPMPHESKVWKLTFSPDGRYLFTFTEEGFVRAWNVADGSPASPPLHQRAVNNAYPGRTYFSPDGQIAITAGSASDARSFLWRLDGGKTLQPAPLAVPFSRDIQFSPDGSCFVAVNQGSTIWDTARVTRRVAAQEQSAKLNAVAFSPESSRIVTATDDGTARVWDARTGRPMTPPMRHQKAVMAVGFSPDGRNVVTGGADGGVRIWDAGTGEAVTPILPMRGSVLSVEFTEDGKRFLAVGEAESKIWDVRTNTRSTESIAAVSQLLSGVRMDSLVGSVAVDRSRLQECWREYNRR